MVVSPQCHTTPLILPVLWDVRASLCVAEMEFACSSLSHTQLTEQLFTLEQACHELKILLPSDCSDGSTKALRDALRVHKERREVLRNIVNDDMREYHGDILQYVDPWLADRASTEVMKSSEIDSEELFASFPRVPFGAAMKRTHFELIHNHVFLNTGSYGATPRVVLQARANWERCEMHDPIAWRQQVLPFRLRQVQNRLAQFVHCHPADLVLMVNANTATSTVLKSLPWEVGDTILFLSCDYDATKLAGTYLAEAYGVKVLYIDMVLPLTDDEIINMIDSFLDVRQKQGDPMPLLANFCHITSKTGWIFPAARMTATFHKYGIPVMVDGAQATGHIRVDTLGIGAEFYIGTCHKWMFACQGIAFLVVAPSKQNLINPLAPEINASEPFARAFAMTGAFDFSGFLAVLQSFEFVDRVCGGWKAVWQHNRLVARSAADELSRMWKLEAEGLRCIQLSQMSQDSDEFNCMPIVPLPNSQGATDSVATKLMGLLLTKFNITAFLLAEKFRLADGSTRKLLCVRITAQIHLTMEDIQQFGRAILELAGSSYGTLGVIKEYLPEAVQGMIS